MTKNMKTLENKVAIVTGGSRGIGRAISLKLGALGAYVVVNHSNSTERANEVVQLIEKSGSKAVAVKADISNTLGVRNLFDEALDAFGQVDILVNNAGYSKFIPTEFVTEEEFDKMFATNTKGPFFALQQAARLLNDNGRIINISTGGTATPGAATGLYTGSKAALEQFTFALSKELGSKGITVNAVSPGLADTEMLAQVAPAELKANAAKMASLGRLGQPEDIADVVAFLASPEARWVTGQNIRVTGGI
jgi:3-oxoacyl-[acyl-carrier protein] reductase